MPPSDQPLGRGRLRYNEDRRKAQKVQIWQTPRGLLIQVVDRGRNRSEPFHWTEDQIYFEMIGEGDALVMELAGPNNAVLEISDKRVIAALTEDGPPPPPPPGNLGLITFVAVAVALAACVVIGPYIFLQRLAQVVPHTWELSVVDRLHERLLGNFCESPDQADALDALVKRLDPKGIASDHVHLHLVDTGQVNLYAMPDGDFMLEINLLNFVDDSAELAAVVAHELQHNVKRDELAHLMLAAIKGNFWRLVTSIVQRDEVPIHELAAVPFSADAEQSADAGTVTMLNTAHVDSGAMERLLRKLESTGSTPRPAEMLVTHPTQSARRAALHKLAPGVSQDATPAMTRSEFELLRSGCRKH